MQGNSGTTNLHPIGTCKKCPAAQSGKVIDAELRVLGLEGLRVFEPSATPTITSGNTDAPTLKIAEKGAGFVQSNRRAVFENRVPASPPTEAGEEDQQPVRAHVTCLARRKRFMGRQQTMRPLHVCVRDKSNVCSLYANAHEKKAVTQ